MESPRPHTHDGETPPFHPKKSAVGLCLFLRPIQGATGLCHRAYILHPFNRNISCWDYQKIPNRTCLEHLNHLDRAVPSTRRKRAAFKIRALIRTRCAPPGMCSEQVLRPEACVLSRWTRGASARVHKLSPRLLQRRLKLFFSLLKTRKFYILPEN